MQIENVELVQLGSNRVRVEYRGEGGESIFVTMAVAADTPKQEVFDKARALMVQIATAYQPDDKAAVPPAYPIPGGVPI